jgi:hypothetical protein
MRLVYLSKNPEQIAIEFQGIPKWKDNSDLIDHVEPFPLEVFGSYVAYPLIEEGVITAQFITDLFNAVHSNDPEQQRRAIGMLADLNKQQTEQVATEFAMKKAKAEKLITLPTRGVFAEGKLGHCNISEEIDNTRFWKWEEHPIPFEAPGINPVTPISPQPQQTNIAPTAFPTSLVNIVNPSPAPDPTGLSDALKVLATPNIFRDMSGRAEVADLLKKLSDNTIGFQEAANKAREIQGKYGSDLSGGTGNSGTSSGGTGSAGSNGGSATDSKKSGGAQPTSSDRINDAKNAMQIADQMSPANKNAIQTAAADSVVKALTNEITNPAEEAKKADSAQAKLQFSKEFSDRIDPGSMTIFEAYFDLPIGTYGRQVIDQVSALLRAGSLRGIVRSDNLPFLDGRLTGPQQIALRNAVSGLGNAAFAFFRDFEEPSLFSPIGAIVFVRNITITPTHPQPDLGFQINSVNFNERDNEWRAAMAHEIVHAINPTSVFFPNNLVHTGEIWADQTLLSGDQSDVITLRLFTGEIIGRYANWLVWRNILDQSEAVLPNEIFLATRDFLINFAAVPTIPPNPPAQPLYDISGYMQRLVAKANAKAIAADANLINKQASLWLKLVSQHFSLLYPEPTARMQKLFLDASTMTGETTAWSPPSGTPRGLN